MYRRFERASHLIFLEQYLTDVACLYLIVEERVGNVYRLVAKRASNHVLEPEKCPADEDDPNKRPHPARNLKLRLRGWVALWLVVV